MGELRHREIEEVDAFERQHRDQRLEAADDVAAEQPHHIHAGGGRERPEQIDRMHVAGQTR